MQKRSSKRDEPDPNILAKSIVDQVTGQTPPPSEDVLRAAMREMGRRGGLKGGKARAESLSKAKRAEIAKNAARARWGR